MKAVRDGIVKLYTLFFGCREESEDGFFRRNPPTQPVTYDWMLSILRDIRDGIDYADDPYPDAQFRRNARCGMCIIPGQVNPYFPAICGQFLCVPYAFLHFWSSGTCVRVQEIWISTTGIPEIIRPLSDMIHIHPAPPMSFSEVYWCVFALSCLLFTCLDIIPLVFRFGTELPSIALFFLTFP